MNFCWSNTEHNIFLTTYNHLKNLQRQHWLLLYWQHSTFRQMWYLLYTVAASDICRYCSIKVISGNFFIRIQSFPCSFLLEMPREKNKGRTKKWLVPVNFWLSFSSKSLQLPDFFQVKLDVRPANQPTDRSVQSNSDVDVDVVAVAVIMGVVSISFNWNLLLK